MYSDREIFVSKDRLLPCQQQSFLQPEESVILNNFQHLRCIDFILQIWRTICQHKPMAITSATAYVVCHLPYHCVCKITGYTNRNTLRCWKLLSITFSSDLRKPCCHDGKCCSPTYKNSVFENICSQFNSSLEPNGMRTLHIYIINLTGIMVYPSFIHNALK